ncbi:MAG: hemolysin family protein [Spirochaetaceae bacterium]|jgi:putative hemolysin|nr:hemolysin family protein [Spirochaetaceae bacterium]
MSIIFAVCTLILLVVLSAFFSAAETAFVSLSRLKIHQMAKEKMPHIRDIIKLTSNSSRMLTTILIGNNLVNNFASSLATALAISLFGHSGVGIATGVMTLVIIIFGEIVPKTIASRRGEPIASGSAHLLLILQTIMFPFVWFFSTITKGITWTVGRIWKQNAPLVTEEELKTMIDVGSQEGTLETGERDMLHRVFAFTDLRVREIMRSRTLICAVSADAGYQEAVERFKACGYSRLPVYNGTIDDITGIVHYKDLLFFQGDRSSFTVRQAAREALFVPGSKTGVSLLHTFRTTRQNLAIVVNEHGSNAGIVSMDDILKAVFGRITDEYNKSDLAPEERIEILSGREFLVAGNIPLQDVNAIFSLNLESEFYQTLGGWLLESFDSLPSEGDALYRYNVRFIVEEQTSRRIQLVRLLFDYNVSK